LPGPAPARGPKFRDSVPPGASRSTVSTPENSFGGQHNACLCHHYLPWVNDCQRLVRWGPWVRVAKSPGHRGCRAKAALATAYCRLFLDILYTLYNQNILLLINNVSIKISRYFFTQERTKTNQLRLHRNNYIS